MATQKPISESSSRSANPLAATKPAAVARKAPAKAKPAGTPQVAAKASPKKAVAKAASEPAVKKPSAGRAKKFSGVPAEQRRNYIEMAAYYIAERRGFTPGDPLEDWVQAEAEIDRLLAEGRLGG